jgi:hypothetical protein
MNRTTSWTVSGVALITALIAVQAAPAQTAFQAKALPPMEVLRAAKPFQDNNGLIPPKGVYSGPLFKLNHAWPATLPPLGGAPWQVAIDNGTINVKNAPAYAKALKDAVTKNGRDLIMHYDTWDAAKAGWYNEPWLGSLREAIHGTYDAGQFGPSIFPGTGLRATFQTHVLTYYDARAAYTMHTFWGDSAMKPDLRTGPSQFAEGSIIVKAAVFTSTNPAMPRDWWDALKGAQEWPIYEVVAPSRTDGIPQPWPGYVAQFDIIVKDSHSSPKTGWVFMTLVYDSSVPGDAWDKMVPLGVQWGNDPQADRPGIPLQENWNNPKAPLYATQTLGWGGRLSGPNDGGRNDIAVNGKPMPNTPNSSCMSCHSTAQWNNDIHRMPSFLLPSFATAEQPYFQTCGKDGKPVKGGTFICSPEPGSKAWMKWFQNRLGTQSMDEGSFATDFDEVFSFKALGLWWAATGPANQSPPVLLRLPGQPAQFNQYTGAPLPAEATTTAKP